MNSLVAGLTHFLADALEKEKEMCEEFSKRKKAAEKKYWDACKYPRKTKKRMRKEALNDYELYSYLEKPFLWL